MCRLLIQPNVVVNWGKDRENLGKYRNFRWKNSNWFMVSFYRFITMIFEPNFSHNSKWECSKWEQDRRTKMSESLIFSIQPQCKSHLVKSDSLCSLFYFHILRKEEIRWWKQICPWKSQCTGVVRRESIIFSHQQLFLGEMGEESTTEIWIETFATKLLLFLSTHEKSEFHSTMKYFEEITSSIFIIKCFLSYQAANKL